MKSVIWLVLLAIAAVVAATTFGRNDGLVSLYWNGWRLDLSMNLFLLGLVGSCVALLVALRGVQSLITLPTRAAAWRMQRRERAAQSALREALAEYFGARYSRAHKAAERAIAIHQATPGLQDEASTRGLAHLLAGASLHRLQDRPQRDRQIAQLEALQREHKKSGAARATDDAVTLLAAEWAIDDRDAERALTLLAALPPGVARRTQALRLKLQAQRLAGDPAEGLRTARLLAKHQAFTPGAAQGLLRSLAIEALDGARDIDQLERAWQQLDAVDHADAFVAARGTPRRGVRRRHARPRLAAAAVGALGRVESRGTRGGVPGAGAQPGRHRPRLAAAPASSRAGVAARGRGASRRRQRVCRARLVGQGALAARTRRRHADAHRRGAPRMLAAPGHAGPRRRRRDPRARLRATSDHLVVAAVH
jgi:heme biosynthesis-associated TPR repeat protein